MRFSNIVVCGASICSSMMSCNISDYHWQSFFTFLPGWQDIILKKENNIITSMAIVPFIWETRRKDFSSILNHVLLIMFVLELRLYKSWISTVNIFEFYNIIRKEYFFDRGIWFFLAKPVDNEVCTKYV